EITPLCAEKAQVFPIAGGGKPLGNGTLARAAGANSAFRSTPQFDAATLALAAGLIQEQGLGKGAAPDLVAIGLSATDYVGHTYGTGGQEMCLQLTSLDRDLGDFMALLDRWGLDYAVALTADHGGLDIPERLRARGVADAAWIDPALAPKAIGTAVATKLGRSSSLIASGGPSGDIYLDPALTGADRARALSALAAAYRAHPQVAAIFTKAELGAAAAPSGDPAQWPLITRVRASFDAARSGDLYVVLKPHIMPIVDTSAYVATHGSPWDYDRRVPILLWRKGMAPAPREEAIETIDIMPTLSALLGLAVAPGSVDGKCLASVDGIACPPR
ncbi:MAG: alkaline phosphatase family protein, partial [Sphingomicrobium sp.]